MPRSLCVAHRFQKTPLRLADRHGTFERAVLVLAHPLIVAPLLVRCIGTYALWTSD